MTVGSELCYRIRSVIEKVAVVCHEKWWGSRRCGLVTGNKFWSMSRVEFGEAEGHDEAVNFSIILYQNFTCFLSPFTKVKHFNSCFMLNPQTQREFMLTEHYQISSLRSPTASSHV